MFVERLFLQAFRVEIKCHEVHDEDSRDILESRK